MGQKGFTSETARKAGKKSGKPLKSKQWELLSGSILTTHAARFDQILQDSDDEKFGQLYLTVLNYFKPKMQSAQIKTEGSLTITIIPVDDEVISTDL